MPTPTNTPDTPDTCETELVVTGMHCSSCERPIDSALRALPGVTRVEIDRRSGRVRVAHAHATSSSALVRAIEAQGYLATTPGSNEGGRAGHIE